MANGRKTLDLGCGERKTEGAVGMDLHALPGVDIVHDLTKFPYPIEDNTFDRFVLRHVVEHVPDIVGLMGEIHRIGRPGARVEIFTPHYTSSLSYMDPTHIHHFSFLTFDFFCGATAHGYVARHKFRLVSRNCEMWALHDRIPFVPYHWLGIRRLALNHPIFFERFLCFLFPVKEISVVLEVVKE